MITFDLITGLALGVVLGLVIAFVGGYIVERKTIGAQYSRAREDFEQRRARVRRKLAGK